MFSQKFYQDMPSPSCRKTIFTGGCSSRYFFLPCDWLVIERVTDDISFALFPSRVTRTSRSPRAYLRLTEKPKKITPAPQSIRQCTAYDGAIQNSHLYVIRFCILNFGNVLRFSFVIRNLCDLYPIKIRIFVLETVHIPNKRRRRCLQHRLWHVALVVRADNQTLWKNNS